MNHAHTRGFTLIELLLYVSIVGILLLGITAFFAISAEARIKNQSISEVNQQGQFVMDILSQTIRNADSITLPAIGGSGNQLTAAVPTTSLNPTTVSLSGTTLQIKEGSAAALPLTNTKVEVSNLVIQNLSRTSTPGIVQISLTISRTNPNNRPEYSFQKTFTTSVSVRH